MRYSRQRELVLREVRAGRHRTAEEIYRALEGEQPRISLATVYRNLGVLTHRGLIRKVPMPEGGDRFDGEVAPHCHLVCERCGAVLDAPMPAGCGLPAEAAETGFTAHSYELLIHGLCKGCGEQ